MKIRQAKKILNMMAKGTDTRYFDSKYTFKKESRFIPRLKNLYQKATIRWNKVNMPSANVSLFRSILRTSKECGRCKHFNGMFAGRCTKLHEYVENSDGNTNVRFYQAETHKRFFALLEANSIRVNRFRADCG